MKVEERISANDVGINGMKRRPSHQKPKKLVRIRFLWKSNEYVRTAYKKWLIAQMYEHNKLSI